MIKGENIYLKQLSSKDINISYLNWMNDKEITRFMVSNNNTYTENDLMRYVEDMNKSENNFLYGIYLKNNDKYIGNIKIGNVDSPNNSADIGLMIGERSEWGKGYASEAINCIVDYAFQTLNLSRVWAGMYKINYGSYKAFINNGFTEIENSDEKFLFEGKLEDTVKVEKENK